MSEQMKDIIGFAGMILLIFGIIFVFAVLTPKIAKLVDKVIGRVFKNGSPDRSDDIYKVRSIYDKPERPVETSDKSTENGEEKNGEK